MAKQGQKSSKSRDTRSRKMRDLPAKPVGGRKAASVRGGGESKPVVQPTESVTFNYSNVEWKYTP